MAHKEKYSAGAVGKLCQHYERKKDENGEYIKFGNQDIDLTKTHLNYNLAPRREDGQVAFINHRKSEVYCMNRADIVVMCSWVVTMPQVYKTHPDSPIQGIVLNDEGHKHRCEEFFERSYRFLTDRYGGEKNVISAYVHMDETTPHMHFAFVPVVDDKKRGGFKISAKEAITQQDLKTFHTDLEKHLDSFKDWHYEVINEATKDGNKTIVELKKETAYREVEKAQQEAYASRHEADSLRADVEKYQEMKISIGDVKMLASGTSVLDRTMIKTENLKTLTEMAKSYTVNRKEILSVRSRAAMIGKWEVAADRREREIEKRYNTVEARAKAVGDEARNLEVKEKEVDAMYARQSNLNLLYEQQQQENIRLRNQLSEVEKENAIHRLKIGDLTDELGRAMEKYSKELNDVTEGLTARLRVAYESMTRIVKAIGMLKWDEGVYKAELTPKQGRLVEAIGNYAEKAVDSAGFKDFAEKIRKEIGLAEVIKTEVKALEPKSKSRGYER